MTLTKEFNLDLLLLYYALFDLNNNSFPDDIQEHINKIIEKAENRIFPIIPNGYDIEDERFYVKATYKK